MGKRNRKLEDFLGKEDESQNEYMVRAGGGNWKLSEV